ncbi:YjiH family protein [Corticicoccus populi]|uniref:YjiH family protein n=1 Tax=Corticicoccus populi TaxID=1812821 RepID=A0ABW5WUI6_9STAP
MRNTATLLKFIIPSLIGIFMFLCPVRDEEGNITIPIAFVANWIIETMGASPPILVVLTLIIISAVLTVIFSWIVKPKSDFISNLFSVTPIWVIFRLLGAVFVVLAYLNVGPEMIRSESTGAMILYDLLPTLFAVFLLAGLLLPLLLNYGLLEFVGSLFVKVMRPLFRLPGRSAVDNIASWVGDGTVGVLLSSKQYEQGFYSKREAVVSATTFSVVSITFTVVIIDYVDLMQHFPAFYLTIVIAGIVAALIMPRIPPLSRVEDSYYVENHETDESIPEGYNMFSWGYKKALERAEKAENVGGFLKDGVKTVFDMWFAVLPIVMAIGTLGTIVAEYTPLFTWIGAPFVPVLELMGIEDAVRASETLFIGFTDMFLPSILISDVSSEMTRFVIAALSISQLIYLSEVGGVILGSKIPVGLGKLFVIFLIRTIISLPIIVIAAHIIF